MSKTMTVETPKGPLELPETTPIVELALMAKEQGCDIRYNSESGHLFFKPVQEVA